ncbi:MAG TPA: ABC transporter permease [Hyphomicrobiaceae bacterium]|jgi:ABC-type nitrate/sulfonate/bicarbonate transport system permease component|nr:ABC transporter permease [Hyphomicrobiaceae bacterium]
MTASEVSAEVMRPVPRARVLRWATDLLPFVVGVAIWQLLSFLEIWPRVLFPSPLEVLAAFAEDLRTGVLLVNLGVSLKSLGLGFVIGAIFAVPLGYLMGLNRFSRDFFDPLVNLLQAIPGLAWIPFAILWFGLGQGAVTFIIVMSVFFPVLHNLLTGIRMVQPVLIEAVQTLGAGRVAVIRHVIFPSTLPNLMTGVRLGIAFGFRSLVGGEMIASTDGLGYAIFNAQQYFQSARIVVGMLAIGITWLLMDRLILRPIELRTTLRWGLVREGLEST